MPRLSSSEDQSEDNSSQKADDDWTSSGLPDREDVSVCTVPVELSSNLWHCDSMQSLVMDFGPSLTEILEGISFSDTYKRTEAASGLTDPIISTTNEDPFDFNIATNIGTMEVNQSRCDIQVLEPKGLACWEPATIAEDMEMDTDSGITGSEQDSRVVNADLWDSGDGDGSEIEM